MPTPVSELEKFAGAPPGVAEMTTPAAGTAPPPGGALIVHVYVTGDVAAALTLTLNVSLRVQVPGATTPDVGVTDTVVGAVQAETVRYVSV